MHVREINLAPCRMQKLHWKTHLLWQDWFIAITDWQRHVRWWMVQECISLESRVVVLFLNETSLRRVQKFEFQPLGVRSGELVSCLQPAITLDLFSHHFWRYCPCARTFACHPCILPVSSSGASQKSWVGFKCKHSDALDCQNLALRSMAVTVRSSSAEQWWM